MVPLNCRVGDFLDRMDGRGRSTRRYDLPETCSVECSGETNYLKTDAYVDVLVWRAETLSLDSYFGYYVEFLGMSLTEAVDVIIVRQHRMTLDAASRAN